MKPLFGYLTRVGFTSNSHLARAALTWAAVGACCGSAVLTSAHLPAAGILGVAAAVATGAAVGVRGVLALTAGAGTFILVGEICVALAGDGRLNVGQSVIVIPILGVVIAVGLSLYVLIGAALRWAFLRVW